MRTPVGSSKMVARSREHNSPACDPSGVTLTFWAQAADAPARTVRKMARAVVARAKAGRRKWMLFVPPMVASKRVPASRLDALPVSIGWPLYQSRAPPEFPALVTEQDDRTDTRIERAAPAGTSVTEPSA